MIEEKRPPRTAGRLKRITETAKSVLLTALFLSMTVLACVYIVRTQRMTLESADAIDIGRMLTLRPGGDSFSSGLSQERVLPECVAVKADGSGRAVTGGRSVLAGALSLLTDPLENILSDSSDVTEVPEDDSEAVWLACCSAEDSVYIRFRSPLPSPILSLYISGGDEEISSAKACYIREIFILPGEETSDGDSRRSCRAVARDGEGRTLRIDGEDLSIDLPSVVSYASNSEFSDFFFAGDIDRSAEAPRLELDDSAIVTVGEAPQLCAVFSYDAAGKLMSSPEALLTLFGYNMSRISEYEDPDTGDVIYIETWGNLRLSADSVSFSATGQRGGIDVSRWLPYGRTGGSYTLYELLRCSENFISGLSSIDPGMTGGDAQLYLRDVYASDGGVTVSYRFIFNGIDVVCGDRGIDITFSDGMIKELSVRPMTAVNQLTRLLNLSMARCFEGKADASFSGSGRIALIYPAEGSEPGEQITAEWAFITAEGNITRQDDDAAVEPDPDTADETADDSGVEANPLPAEEADEGGAA